MGKANRCGFCQGAGQNANTNPQHRREHQKEIRCGSGQRHPRRTTRMPVTPDGIIRSAAPADHPSAEDVGENWNDHSSKDFAANLGQGIERHLTARCEITTPSGGQSVRGFVTGQGKRKTKYQSTPRAARLGLIEGQTPQTETVPENDDLVFNTTRQYNKSLPVGRVPGPRATLFYISERLMSLCFDVLHQYVLNR